MTIVLGILIVESENCFLRIRVLTNELAKANPLAFPPSDPEPMRRKLPFLKLECLVKLMILFSLCLIDACSSRRVI